MTEGASRSGLDFTLSRSNHARAMLVRASQWLADTGWAGTGVTAGPVDRVGVGAGATRGAVGSVTGVTTTPVTWPFTPFFCFVLRAGWRDLRVVRGGVSMPSFA